MNLLLRRSLPLMALLALAASGCTEDPVDPGPGPAAQIQFGEAGDTLSVGSTLRLEVEVSDADGREIEGAELEWSSSDPDLAGVSGGVVEAKSWNGLEPTVVTITATAGGASEEKDLVIFPRIDRLWINLGDRILAGREKALRADLVTDTPGYGYELIRLQDYPVVWSSTDPTVLEITGDGAVEAGRPGRATLIARYFGGEFRREVEVVSGGYAVEPIEVEGMPVSGVQGVNSHGDLVVRVESADATKGYAIIGGVPRDLGIVLPSGIDDAGRVIGQSPYGERNTTRALLWADGEVVDLLPEHPEWVTISKAISPNGRILVECGYLCQGNEDSAGFLYENGSAEPLYPGGLYNASDMNDDLVVVGRSVFNGGLTEAIRWSPEGETVRTFSTYRSVDAPAVNSEGEWIAFHTRKPWEADPINTLSWRFRGGDRVAIEGLGWSTRAADIADDGTVVGTTLSPDRQEVAFLETADSMGLIEDLVAETGWSFADAFLIGNGGHIVARATREGEAERFVLLRIQE